MINLLCYGDSNTWGYMPGSGTRYPVEQRWTSILQKKLGKEYHVAEFGLCGMNTGIDDTERVLNRNGKRLFPAIVAAHQPLDLVILMLGTNDWKTQYQTSAKQTGENLAEMIRYIKGSYPWMKIVLASPAYVDALIITDLEFDSSAVTKAKDTERILKKIAAREEIEFFQTSLSRVQIGSDGCHFTKEGHEMFANALAPCVESLMKTYAISD